MKTFSILFIYAVFFLANNSYGQEFYLIGGINISELDQSKDNTGYNDSRTIQPGFQIGSGMDIKFNNYLSFMPQVLFSLKREKIISEIIILATSNPSLIRTESQLNNFYLDIPLNLKLKYSFNKIEIFAFAGPYGGLLLFDNSTDKSYLNGEPVELEHLDEKFINRLDYGLNCGIGIQANSYFITISYDSGFYREKKYEEVVFKNKVKNSIIRLSIGFKI